MYRKITYFPKAKTQAHKIKNKIGFAKHLTAVSKTNFLWRKLPSKQLF